MRINFEIFRLNRFRKSWAGPLLYCLSLPSMSFSDPIPFDPTAMCSGPVTDQRRDGTCSSQAGSGLLNCMQLIGDKLQYGISSESKFINPKLLSLYASTASNTNAQVSRDWTRREKSVLNNPVLGGLQNLMIGDQVEVQRSKDLDPVLNNPLHFYAGTEASMSTYLAGESNDFFFAGRAGYKNGFIGSPFHSLFMDGVFVPTLDRKGIPNAYQSNKDAYFAEGRMPDCRIDLERTTYTTSLLPPFLRALYRGVPDSGRGLDADITSADSSFVILLTLLSTQSGRHSLLLRGGTQSYLNHHLSLMSIHSKEIFDNQNRFEQAVAHVRSILNQSILPEAKAFYFPVPYSPNTVSDALARKFEIAATIILQNLWKTRQAGYIPEIRYSFQDLVEKVLWIDRQSYILTGHDEPDRPYLLQKKTDTLGLSVDELNKLISRVYLHSQKGICTFDGSDKVPSIAKYQRVSLYSEKDVLFHYGDINSDYYKYFGIVRKKAQEFASTAYNIITANSKIGLPAELATASTMFQPKLKNSHAVLVTGKIKIKGVTYVVIKNSWGKYYWSPKSAPCQTYFGPGRQKFRGYCFLTVNDFFKAEHYSLTTLIPNLGDARGTASMRSMPANLPSGETYEASGGPARNVTSAEY